MVSKKILSDIMYTAGKKLNYEVWIYDELTVNTTFDKNINSNNITNYDNDVDKSVQWMIFSPGIQFAYFWMSTSRQLM